jgi:hypothetical protein
MANQDRKYNEPKLSPLAFLRAVYSDASVPMIHRMRAAEVAALYDSTPMFLEREPWPGEHRIRIIIQGLHNNAPELIERGPEPKVH